MKQPQVNNVVIQRITNYRGIATYGHKTTVKSVYKSGNVRLTGVEGQHNVSHNRNGDYELTPCGATTRTGPKFVALTAATRADMKHSEAMQELADTLYAFENVKRREQAFNAQDVNTLNAHTAALKSILKTVTHKQ